MIDLVFRGQASVVEEITRGHSVQRMPSLATVDLLLFYRLPPRPMGEPAIGFWY